MSEEKKDEDFVGMLKRMKSDMKSPSFIGDTLDKLEKLQAENERLKNQLNQSIELIRSSEDFLKKTLEEKEMLKQDNIDVTSRYEQDIMDLKNKNASLSEKIVNLENLVLEKNENLKIMEREISVKKAQAEIQNAPPIQQNDVSSDLKEKEENISELENRIDLLQNEIGDLTNQNNLLKKQLAEQQAKLNVDYVVPVVEATTTAKKPDVEPTSISTLETLCQDLQSDLNKYKRMIDSLKAENKELSLKLETGDKGINYEELKTLREENNNLKAKLSELEDTIEKTPLELTLSLDSEDKIKSLQEELNQKDDQIADLKASLASQTAGPEGSMAGLVDDLQANINKLRIALREKDKIIEELKNQ
jgi:chromosome segregation ATPase